MSKIRSVLRPTPVLLALALSGFAALVYEICWMRLASLAFGSTVYATSTVLGVYFAGLALGGELAGRMSARLAQPLRAFAWLELTLGVAGVLSPLAFRVAESLYGAVYGAFGDEPALLATGRLVMVAALVLVPASCMGASLPLCTRAIAAVRRDAAGAAARLYATNTLGALAGCAAAGLALIPWLGVQLSVGIAGIANCAAALIAFRLARPAAAQTQPTSVPPPHAPLLGALVLAGGAVALANEVLWTRYLGLLVHNSVYTYTLALAVVLAGIVLGSALAPALLRACRTPAGCFGTLQVGIGLLVLATALLPPRAWAWASDSLVACAALLLPASVLSGASFPVAVQLLLRDAPATGAGVGHLYALNTVGGIVGALGAGFLLLPLLGLQTSLLLTSGVSVAAGVLAWTWLGGGDRSARTVAGSVAAAGAWLALPALAGTRVPHDFLAAGRELVEVREGMSADVAVVREEGELQLEIDRWWQGSTRKGHQAVAAHVPMLLHPDPRSVLVIGAGAGQTPSRVLMYDVGRLDVVDIEPAVFGAIEEHFESGWMRDARVHLVRDDGRNYLLHGKHRYDVISIEAGQISRPGVASFYTVDFYERARERLEDGGLIVQFVPLPFFTLGEFRGVVRTFTEVFPASLLWYNTAELLLIGRNGSDVAVSAQRLLDLGGDAAVEADLHYAHWGGPAQWLSGTAARLGGFLLGPRALAAIAEPGTVYRDDRPVLEYAAARASEARSGEAAITALLRAQVEPVSTVLGIPLDEATAREAESIRATNLMDILATAELRRMRAAQAAGQGAEMVAHLRLAVAANPLNVLAQRLLADALVSAGNSREAESHYRQALAVEPHDSYAHRGLAFLLQVQGRGSEAITHYRAALDARPNDAEAHNNLGTALARSGDLAGAERHFRTALELRPGYGDAQRNLQRLIGAK